jgi:hypothetical protein
MKPKHQSLHTFLVVISVAGIGFCLLARLILVLPPVKSTIVCFLVHDVTSFVETHIIHQTLNPAYLELN